MDTRTVVPGMSEFCAPSWNELEKMISPLSGYRWKQYVLGYRDKLHPKRGEMIRVQESDSPDSPPFVELVAPNTTGIVIAAILTPIYVLIIFLL